jgi:hypothetical protein
VQASAHGHGRHRSLNLGLPRGGGTHSPIRIPRIFETPGDWFSHGASPPPECPIQWHIVPSSQTELNWYSLKVEIRLHWSIRCSFRINSLPSLPGPIYLFCLSDVLKSLVSAFLSFRQDAVRKRPRAPHAGKSAASRHGCQSRSLLP